MRLVGVRLVGVRIMAVRVVAVRAVAVRAVVVRAYDRADVGVARKLHLVSAAASAKREEDGRPVRPQEAHRVALLLVHKIQRVGDVGNATLGRRPTVRVDAVDGVSTVGRELARRHAATACGLVVSLFGSDVFRVPHVKD